MNLICSYTSAPYLFFLDSPLGVVVGDDVESEVIIGDDVEGEVTDRVDVKKIRLLLEIRRKKYYELYRG